jgi:gamma-glutamyltranspeptidase/glutathione hydrolase
MADADWVDVPLEGLIDKAYAELRSQLVNSSAVHGPTISFVADLQVADIAAPGHPQGAQGIFGDTGDRESTHTTHFSIADPYGNVASVTSTINEEFGNGLVVPGLGFLLNNELTDFSSTGRNKPEGGKRPRKTALPPDNLSLGGKRPRSSMTPTIITKDGNPRLLVGSPGGSSIIGKGKYISLADRFQVL